MIRLIDTALQGQSLDRVDFRVADNIFKVPLHSVNPVFYKEFCLDGAIFVRVGNFCVHIISLMIKINGGIEKPITFFCKFHLR